MNEHLNRVKEERRDARGIQWLEILVKDLQFAVRTLRKTPTVTTVAVLTLALGVGLNTAIFSVAESVLLNQLPYRDPSRIVALEQVDSNGTPADDVSGETLREWRARSRSLESVSAYGDAQLTLVDNGDAEVLRGMRVSSEFFETLGVNVRLGRTFVPEDDRSSRASVIIFSHELWTRRFAADPAIVGRVLELRGEPYRVIGVLPADFHPLHMTNPAEMPQIFLPGGDGFGGRVIARLKPFVAVSQARAELNAVMREIVRADPGDYPHDTAVRVEPLQDQLIGPVRTALSVLSGAVVFVLLIACANVASLQLARAAARTKEFAVRGALGGGRARLAAQLLSENLLLAIVGGGAGVLLGWLGTSVIASLAPAELPRLDEIHMDAPVLLSALAISVLTGLVFGVAPAWSASRVDLNDALKRAGAPTGRAQLRGLRDALVVMDLALAFVLVVAAGLLGRSLQNLRTVDSGFNPHHVLTLTPAITANGPYATREGRLQYYRQLIEKVQAVPGVTGVGMVSNVPLSHLEPMLLRIEGQPSPRDAEAPTADVFWVSPDYCRVLQIPLKRGRFLTDQDGVTAPPAVIVSESFAQARFGGMDPIGHRIRLGSQQDLGPWLVIVGIVGDVRNDALDRAPRDALYQPQAMNPFHYTRLVARTAGDPWRFERAVRAAIRDADPAQTVFHVQPMDDYIASSLADRSFALGLIALFGVLGMLLSAIGIYGLMSYSVVQRTPEIGVRAALGASRAHVVALVLRQGMTLTGMGLGLGLLVALGVTRLLAIFLFGVRPSDPSTLAATVGVLACVAAVACYVPARTAARIEPLAALRAD